MNLEYSSALFSDEYDLVSMVMETCLEEVSHQTHQEITDLVHELQQLTDMMPDILSRLESFALPFVAKQLQERAQADAASGEPADTNCAATPTSVE